MSTYRPYDARRVDAVAGEFTRLLLSYWELVGHPPLQEFVSMIPIQEAIMQIEMIDKEPSNTGTTRKAH